MNVEQTGRVDSQCVVKYFFCHIEVTCICEKVCFS